MRQPLGHAEVTGLIDGRFRPQRLAQRRVGPAGCPADPPSEPCVPLIAAHGSSKPRGRAVWLYRVLPADAGTKPAMAGGVHEAGWVPASWAGFPVMDKIAGGYRLAGDVQPPPLPVFG